MSDLSDLPGDLKGLHISLNHLLESCKELRCSTLEIFQDFHELLEKCSEKCKYNTYIGMYRKVVTSGRGYYSF